MANSIKESGAGAALQVTKPARAAGLAEEAAGDDLQGPARWARLADVRVYGFDGLLLVVDRDPDAIAPGAVAELVASAARDTESIYQGREASVRPAGNGCMVSLPGLDDTGFEVGDRAPVTPAPAMLIITDGSRDRARLAEDLVSIRQSQGTPSAASSS